MCGLNEKGTVNSCSQSPSCHLTTWRAYTNRLENNFPSEARKQTLRCAFTATSLHLMTQLPLNGHRPSSPNWLSPLNISLMVFWCGIRLFFKSVWKTSIHGQPIIFQLSWPSVMCGPWFLPGCHMPGFYCSDQYLQGDALVHPVGVSFHIQRYPRISNSWPFSAPSSTDWCRSWLHTHAQPELPESLPGSSNPA